MVSLYAWRGRKIKIYYTARAGQTGLTDVLLNLWGPTTKQVITDQVMTELSDGIYYYDYRFNLEGTYFGYADSATKPGKIGYTISSLTKVGGGAIIDKRMDNLIEGVEDIIKEVKGVSAESVMLKEKVGTMDKKIRSSEKKRSNTLSDIKRNISSQENKLKKEINRSISNVEKLADTLLKDSTEKKKDIADLIVSIPPVEIPESKDDYLTQIDFLNSKKEDEKRFKDLSKSLVNKIKEESKLQEERLIELGNGLGLLRSDITKVSDDANLWIEGNKLREAAKFNPKPSSIDQKYILEQKVGGLRAIVHKKGNIVKIFSEQGRDITKLFPKLAKQTRKLSRSDFILDSRIINQGKYNKLMVFDLLFFEKVSVEDRPEYERKKIIQEQIKFTKDIRPIKAVVITNRDEANKAIKEFRSLPKSKGVIIKKYEGTYRRSAESSAWIEYGDVPVKAKLEEVTLQEGKETMVKDFPQRMRSNFKKVMVEHEADSKKGWYPYVIQWHYRGKEISEQERKRDNISSKYKYRLNSLHADVRHVIPGEQGLEGITVLTPTSTDPKVEDKLERGEAAKKSKIRAVLKLPEPRSWLTAQGIFKKGKAGSSIVGKIGEYIAPGVMVIVSKGKYTVKEITDNKLRVIYNSDSGNTKKSVLEQADKAGILIERDPPIKLKNLDGEWQYTLAHIEKDRWIILLRLIESLNLMSDEISSKIDVCLTEPRPARVSRESIEKIVEMTLSEELHWRSDIARESDMSETAVYRYQKALGLV